MKSKNPFTQVQMNRIKRNKFDLSHEKKMSMKMGFLYPFFHQDTIPGDSFKVNSEVMLRVAPMLTPVMHRMNVYTHFFFVPNRLVWDEWEDFITGGEDGEAEPPFPTLSVKEIHNVYFRKGTLPDYFGIPPTVAGIDDDGQLISALPFRAYQLIYNEYYRDQNLIEKVVFTKASGEIVGTGPTQALTTLRERAWEKDYFTSALPWTQRGGEAAVPISDFDVSYNSVSLAFQSDGTQETGNIDNVDGQVLVNNAAGRIENISGLQGDILINDLRKAARVQEWLEKSARGGSRYIEQIKSFFGVTSSDARLQRPEYLGGGKAPVVISEVLSTAAVDPTGGGLDDTIPQGTMTGHGISVGRGNNFKRGFEEHGQIIGIISVTPKTAYQNGLPKKFVKFDKFDYYFPQFAHLGEQEITRSEIYQTWNAPDSTSVVFGYQQRYAEYKYEPSTVSGDFRDTLDDWHISRQFDENPFLNQTFVTCRPRLDFLAVQDDTDYLWLQIYNHVSALRPMPYFSIPTL